MHLFLSKYMNYRARSLTLFISIVVLCCTTMYGLAMHWHTTRSPQRMTVTMLDIGQGDALYVRFGDGSDMLIDASPDRSVLTELAEVMPWWDRTIDTLILTHPDSDHIAGAHAVMQQYTIGRIFDCGLRDKHTETVKRVYDDIREQDISLQSVYAGDQFDIPSGEQIHILSPKALVPQSEKDSNSCSLVFTISDQNATVLFTGDAPAEIEEQLVTRDSTILDVDVLKVAHHGSNTSSVQSFLDAVTPSIALISVGEHNSYHHPHPSVISRLKKTGAQIFSTVDDGRVRCVSTGEMFECRGE
ncbi:MAG: MBL fold metallo-hydrolase [Candidatus Kerfeldbacteria bacterium]|nr:MBL fold metallo-hydrolase [Candidatus Kerfeldbacteria bacterium]